MMGLFQNLQHNPDWTNEVQPKWSSIPNKEVMEMKQQGKNRNITPNFWNLEEDEIRSKQQQVVARLDDRVS